MSALRDKENKLRDKENKLRDEKNKLRDKENKLLGLQGTLPWATRCLLCARVTSRTSRASQSGASTRPQTS